VSRATSTIQQALSRYLNRLNWRSALSKKEQAAILGLPGRVESFRANHDIVSPGTTVDHACLIAGGLAARYDQMRDGKRQIAAFHFTGDMCDLHSVVCPTAAWAIVAVSRTTVVNVPHRSLRELVDEFPAIAMAFWRDATADASILAKWLGNLGRRGARARLAHLLCESAFRMEKAGIGTRSGFCLDASQYHIADATGMTPVHVNRTFQTLRADELITTEGRMFSIVDWPGLCKVAEFDPAYLLLDLPLNERR
jgi:CRP-like cAMP-binding protein